MRRNKFLPQAVWLSVVSIGSVWLSVSEYLFGAGSGSRVKGAGIIVYLLQYFPCFENTLTNNYQQYVCPCNASAAVITDEIL